MDTTASHATRLPDALLRETYGRMVADPSRYRWRALNPYYRQRRPAAVQELMSAGLTYQSACSHASPEVR
jgi:hypothetical protein